MALLGRTELTTVELPNALEFTIIGEHGWLELIAMPAGILFVSWMFWRIDTPFTRIIVAIIVVSTAASAIASWIQGGSTKLRVTQEELFAEGNLNKLFTTEIRIPASEIESLGYMVGDEGEPGGFYVNRRWSRTCVLPGLNRDQGASVTNAIFKKFPYFAPEYIGSGSLGYGTKSELISLGLSASDSKEDESKP